MINIKDANLNDIAKIEKIHDGSFPMPNVNSPLYFSQKAIINDGEVIGGAFLFLTSEVTLILNSNISKITKAKVIKELFSKLKNELSKYGLRDTHIFILEGDDHFAKVLEKHFRFEKATGIPMYFGE